MRSTIGLVVLPVLVTAMLTACSRLSRAGSAESRPWLAERSAWSETTAAGGEPRGWWAVGNGRVFGIVGPGLPQAQIGQITGPHIMLAGVMNNGSAFNPATLHLSVAGKPVAFDSQKLSRVRGTNVVVMDFDSPTVSMTVLNYAPFDTNAILRTVVVRNKSNGPLADVVLTAAVNRTRVKDGRLYDSFKGSDGAKAMGQTRQLFSSFLEPCEVSGPGETGQPGRGLLTVNLGTLPAGAEAERTQYLVFSMKEVGDEEATLALLKKEGSGLLKKTCDDWRAWMARTTRLECPDQRLVDLLDDTKTLVEIQTARPQCAAGPMEFFAGVWVRDSNGPFLYHLRMGQLDVARKMLEFYYRAAAYNKIIPNNFPMDIDVTQPVDPKLDWTEVRNDPVETPSWLIMQHRWHHEYTGDLDPIREHWGYLRKCLIGQLTDDKGQPVHTVNYGSREPGPNTLYRFPHHGDETWIYPGFEVLDSPLFPEPNDHPHWDAFSADSTWEFVVAAQIMADFARKLGKNADAEEFARIAKDSRAACERDYWMPQRGLYGPALNMRSLDVHQPPFAMVNFNPLWIGYLKPDDPRAVSNVLETMKYTLNPNYVTDVTETLRVYVGMQPGMFLYNLAAIDHPFAEHALKALVEVASPTGEYTEKHVTDPKGYATDFLGHRIRPWEGGINADAAYYYLTGLVPDLGNGRIALCPRMPSAWKQMAVTGQRLGDGTLDLRVSDDTARRTYTLKWTGTKPLTADFKVSLPHARIGAVKVDGGQVNVMPHDRWGLTTATLQVPLPAGQTTVVAVDYQKLEPVPVEFKRERYQYVVPENVPPHDLVLWDSEPRKANEKDLRTFDHLRGRANFRLITAYNPASPAWLRPFLLKADGTTNAPLFLMGPGSVSSSLKYGKWWGDPDLTRLFTEYMEAGGAIVAINTGEITAELFGKLLGDSTYAVAPRQPAPIQPAEGPGKDACNLLGLFDGTAKLQAKRMFIYKNMVPLARPESEAGAASIVAKQYGKGFLMTMLADGLTYERTAALALSLAKPATVAELARLIASAKAESTAGAFEDYSKDGAFHDDFASYKKGSTGVPVWLPLHGTWAMEDGEYHAAILDGYDFISTANAITKGDYKIEATVRLVKGIMEGGFVFNLPSRFAKGSSEMVRFCGHETLWCGPFNSGGTFSLEHSIPTGVKVRDEKPLTLTVTVRNSRGTYDLAVNGTQVAKDLKLTHVAAPDQPRYTGVVSCRGHIAYKDFRIVPIKP